MPHPATLFSNLTFGGFKQPSLGFSLWCWSWVTFKTTVSYSWFLSIRITAEKVWQVRDCLSDNVALDSLLILLLDSYRKLNQVSWSLNPMNWGVFYFVALTKPNKKGDTLRPASDSIIRCWFFIFSLNSWSSLRILGLPNEMWNKFNGIPKIRFRHECYTFRQAKLCFIS